MVKYTSKKNNLIVKVNKLHSTSLNFLIIKAFKPTHAFAPGLVNIFVCFKLP